MGEPVIASAPVAQDRSCEGFVIHKVGARVVSVTLATEMANAITGYDVRPAAEMVAPAGHRCMVLEEPDDAETFWRGGVIVRPDIDKGGPRGSGYIIGVGSLFGVGEAPHPGGLRFDLPHDALGLRVIYGLYQGGIVNLEESGAARSEWVGRYLTMTDRDVWYIDFSPRRRRRDPAEERAAGERLERMRREIAAA